jgi:hypothetical protein
MEFALSEIESDSRLGCDEESPKQQHRFPTTNPTKLEKKATDLYKELGSRLSAIDRKKGRYGNFNLSALWVELRTKMEVCESKPRQTPAGTTNTSQSVDVREFTERAERWRRDTSFQSSLIAKYMHEDYQSIMATGEPVIPLILARLKRAPENWFWALKHLANGFDAARNTDNPRDAAKAWLKWGQEKGYRF